MHSPVFRLAVVDLALEFEVRIVSRKHK
jgi:hypothetical protein